MKKLTRTAGEVFDSVSGEAPNHHSGVLSQELASISDTDLEVWIVTTKQHMDALHGRWLHGIAEYDRRQASEMRHALSTSGWLRSKLRLASNVASSVVRAARGLARMPELADKALAGDVTPDAVAQLDKARRRHPDAYPDHAEVFADIATYLNPSDLRKAIGHWEQQIDYPSAVAKTRRQRERRRLSINQLFDGMWSINGELDPETGAMVNTAIQQASRTGYITAVDTRAPWQVRADALAGICEQSLRRNDHGTSNGVKPHINVTVDAGVLMRLAQGFATVDDAPMPHESLDRLVCDSSIVRILLNEEGSPMDVGRSTRVVPAGMRRALDARDRGCQWNGCDAPPGWCEAHHIKHWLHGGETELDNLTLLCRSHHSAIHESDANKLLTTPARGP